MRVPLWDFAPSTSKFSVYVDNWWTMDPFMGRPTSRPAKRRRVEIDVPEGFLETPNRPPKHIHKPSVPSFSSAFDGQTPATQAPKRSEPILTKPMSRKELPTFLLRGNEEQSGSSVNKPGIGRVNADAATSIPKPRKVVSMQDMRDEFMLDVLIKQTERPQLRPAPRAPPPPSLKGATSSKIPLKQIAAPAFPVNKPPSKVLQPIQPLPPNIIHSSRNKLPPGKDLHTMPVMGPGQLADIFSEQGAEDLASILLRDQNPEIQLDVGTTESLTRRGLELSPEKMGKGNAPKFIRGGLAARASVHFDRTRTAYTLWRRQKEIESQRLNALPTGGDIYASVIKIMHRPLSPTGVQSKIVSPVIALCHIRQPNGNTHALFKADHLYRVAFFSPDIRSRDSILVELEDGHTVRIFKPWNEMAPSESKANDDSDMAGVFPRLPASLPLPISLPFLTPDPLDAPIADKILFCSRFLIF